MIPQHHHLRRSGDQRKTKGVSKVELGTKNRVPVSQRLGPILKHPRPSKTGCLFRHPLVSMPCQAFPSYILLLLLCFSLLLFPFLLITSCPSLLGPNPKIRLQRESRELLKSERSKLWLSSTSKVWSTRPMVKPEEEKW